VTNEEEEIRQGREAQGDFSYRIPLNGGKKKARTGRKEAFSTGPFPEGNVSRGLRAFRRRVSGKKEGPLIPKQKFGE